MDCQTRAKLLNDTLAERLGDDEVRWAIYEKMSATRQRCEYVPGSLCELAMIDRSFEGKKSITVHVLNDEWDEHKLEKTELLVAGFDSAESLDGARFLIEKGTYKLPKPAREVRSVKSWISAQFAIMRGCRKPWAKTDRDDKELPILCDQEFISRYFFDGMEWESRLVQKTYFKREKRQVFFQLARRPRSELP